MAAVHNWNKGSDWIRLAFAHLFPLNRKAPMVIGYDNFISDSKVLVSPYTLMMELVQLMRARVSPSKPHLADVRHNCYNRA